MQKKILQHIFFSIMININSNSFIIKENLFIIILLNFALKINN